MSVVVKFYPAALASLTKSPDGLLGRWMQTRGRIVQLAAIRDCPKRTGKLSESIIMRWAPTLQGQEVRVIARQPYAIYVHEGTKSHVITGNPTLAFMWHGEMAYFHSVQHPGTQPNKFLSKQLPLFSAV